MKASLLHATPHYHLPDRQWPLPSCARASYSLTTCLVVQALAGNCVRCQHCMRWKRSRRAVPALRPHPAAWRQPESQLYLEACCPQREHLVESPAVLARPNLPLSSRSQCAAHQWARPDDGSSPPVFQNCPRPPRCQQPGGLRAYAPQASGAISQCAIRPARSTSVNVEMYGERIYCPHSRRQDGSCTRRV